MQRLIVVGMGKLGGGELNVSSDIDLVFVYPEDGETDGGRSLSNREFFDRLGPAPDRHDQRRDRGRLRLPRRHASAPLRRQRPADGAVLRAGAVPGHAGPLVGALRLAQGARADRRSATTSSPSSSAVRLPQVPRLRRLRRSARHPSPDPRTGHGAATTRRTSSSARAASARSSSSSQALQIVRGGREPALRTRGTLPALAAIAARGLLPVATVELLRAAYVFLRDVEHRLQYRDDRADADRCPTTPRSARRSPRRWPGATDDGFDAALARAPRRRRRRTSPPCSATTGGGAPTRRRRPRPRRTARRLPDPAAFARRLARRRRRRHRDGDAGGGRLPRAGGPAGDARAGARQHPLPAAAGAVAEALRRHRAATARRRGARGRVPETLPQTVFLRLLGLLEAVSRRSAYLALVVEHPPVLPRLAQLMGASQWATDFLMQHPILLDELLDARVLLAEPDWNAWRAELARSLADHAGDAEGQMDALRHFQHVHSFRLLAQDIAGTMTVERLADHLSALADVVLAATLRRDLGAAARRRRTAAPVRDRRLRQARRQGAGLRIGSRHRVRLRRRRRRRAPSATRGSRSASSPGSPARPGPAISTTPTCACAPTARPG